MSKSIIRSIAFTQGGYQVEYSLPGSEYEDGLAHLTAMQVPAIKPFSDIAEEIAELADELIEYAQEEMVRRRSLTPVPVEDAGPEDLEPEVEGAPS